MAQMGEMRIEMCALCGKPAEVVTIRLGGGPAVPITSCECVHGFPGRPQAVMVNKQQWIAEINDDLHQQRTPVRFADLDKGDQLAILKDCNERAVAEVSAHFDKTYGETIERLTNENARLKARRVPQDDVRRNARVTIDTSMWDD